MIDWTDMAPIIPEGEKGEAKIEHVSVSKKEAERSTMRAVVTGGREQPVPAGTYAHLFVNRGLMMSDTPMERRTNTGLVVNAKGDVLIAGLGLGMVLFPILAKATVNSVFIVEKSFDVIDLVEGPLRKALAAKFGQERADDLGILEANIFEWEPPQGIRWDCIYFDIWADKCTDNLEEMSKLHQKFARRKTSKEAWMDSWERSLLKYWKTQGR